MPDPRFNLFIHLETNILMPEKMIPLNSFLEELVILVKERMDKQEKQIDNLQRRVKIMEKVLRETTGGKIKSSILDELKK